MAKVDYAAMAPDLLQRIGGEANVSALSHCATRMRFVLKDESKADSVKKMMETRRDMVKDTAADYTPEETEKLTTAVIGSKGAYVYYAATNDNTKAKEILNNAF